MTVPRYNEQESQQALAVRLASCLRRAGLTMDQAAQRLENAIGRELPHWNLRRLDDDPVWNEVMIVLCDILEVSPSWLAFGGEITWDWRTNFDVPWDEVVERAKRRTSLETFFDDEGI